MKLRFWQIGSLRLSALTLVAGLVAVFFFSPRFVYWRAVDLPVQTSEVVRVKAALEQLEHPFAHFDDHTNRVLRHRLFFPLAGHLLRLPPVVYLALPHLGCLLTLGFAGWVLQRNGCNATQTLAGTVLLATSSWLFVSTGWLAYFDAWYVLGLLVVAFAPSAWWCALAILIAPWIDERFVLTLPLVWVLRRCYFARFPAEGTGSSARQLLLAALAFSPWVIYRAVVSLTHADPVTHSYLADWRSHQAVISFGSYVRGGWHGIRCNWLFVGAAAVLASAAGRVRWTTALLLAGTIALNLFIAEDLSRSVSILMPAALLGLLVWRQHDERTFNRALWAAACANLLLPASHVSGNGVWPVRYLYAELDRLDDPPQPVHPRYWNQRAVEQSSRNDNQTALDYLNFALRLDAGYAEAYANRAIIRHRLGQRDLALRDIETAIKQEPGNPLFLYVRGGIRADAGDRPGAIADLESALRHAPAMWPQRPEAERLLDGLRK